MQSIVLARAAHVLVYVDLLRRIGVPVERDLRRARLPTLLDEMPDAYVSVASALAFLHGVARAEDIPDLGALVVGRQPLRRLAGPLRSAIDGAPTLHGRLRRFGALVAAENTSLRLAIVPGAVETRVCLNGSGFSHVEGAEYAEWLQIDSLIEVVRTAIGASWQPSEIGFRARFQLSPGSLERFPTTRFRTGCRDTSITLPSALLGQPIAITRTDSGRQDEVSGPFEIPLALAAPDFTSALRLALRPYLADGGPDIDLAAEIAGTATRTLQRRLAEHGLSYRTLLRDVRVAAAAEMLVESDSTVLDVAFAVGYDDPSNFARAFRQVTGVSPASYARRLSA